MVSRSALDSAGRRGARAPRRPGAPVTMRYRIDQSLTQEVDATAAGQGKQALTFKTRSFVTVTLTDSAGGRSMRVVVDSMQGDSTTPIPATVFDSARGAVFQRLPRAARAAAPARRRAPLRGARRSSAS